MGTVALTLLDNAGGIVGLYLALTAGLSRTTTPILQVQLRVRVAECSRRPGKATRPVKPTAWVDEHVQAAQRVLQPHGIQLVVQTERFHPSSCALLTRADRDRQATQVRMDGVITVLVLRRVRDLDVPSYDLMGVHWRYGGRERQLRGRRWILLTARARPPVLAHELCHFFGLRHDSRGGNLMTPGPSAPIWRRRGRKPRAFAPVLSPQQVTRLRQGIVRYRRARLEHGVAQHE